MGKIAGTVAALAAVCLVTPSWGLDFRHQRLALAGAPATLLVVDADRDGRNDLASVLVSTDWGEIGVDELQSVDETGTYVEVLTVVPALFERRELVLHLGQADGSYAATPLRLELGESVHALLRGPQAAPLVAWTDDGIAAVEIDGDALTLRQVFDAPSPLAGSRAFLPDLELTADLDGDGALDLLLPGDEGLAVHLATPAGIATMPAFHVPYALDERLPGDARHYRLGTRRHLPLPAVVDLDGDRLPELVFREHEEEWNRLRIVRNLGGGHFGPPIDPLAGRDRRAEPEIVWLGDLDGDGRGELVSAEEISADSDSLRVELREAKRPRYRYRVHALDADLVWSAESERAFELQGYVFGGGSEALGIPAGIGDLDGDGRVDFVALTLDFSLLGALRVMTARSIRLGLDFEPHCQQAGGGFLAAPGQDLGGKFILRLDRLRVGRLSSFAGDFDGDGRADFVQLGRGRRLSVRYGAPGCRFPEAGSDAIELAEEPADLALVRVLDLDGDGRSDLAVTEPPRKGAIAGRGALDLYLARGAR